MCVTLSRSLNSLIAPWLIGAPLTALCKKDGGYRPIAVGEVLRRLASRICCSAAKSRLEDHFLPYGQVGVGIKRGIKAVIHTLQTFIEENSNNNDLCCVKVNMANEFNICDRFSFLNRLQKKCPI